MNRLAGFKDKIRERAKKIREVVKFYQGRWEFPENRHESEEVVRVNELAHEITITGEPITPASLYDVDMIHEDGVLAYGHLLSFHRRVGIDLTVVRTIETPDDVYYEYYEQTKPELKIEDLERDRKKEIREIILHAFEGIPMNQLKLPSGHARRLVI